MCHDTDTASVPFQLRAALLTDLILHAHEQGGPFTAPQREAAQLLLHDLASPAADVIPAKARSYAHHLAVMLLHGAPPAQSIPMVRDATRRWLNRQLDT